MATKAAVITLIAAQLQQQVEKVGVGGITPNSISLMLNNALAIEAQVDATLKPTAKETK